jgi:amidophosphoribosyltransferase
MCGILGIIGNQPVGQDLYDGLTLLQHRGQDAAGIITFDGKKFHQKKDVGLVKDIFHRGNMAKLTGHVGIGHVRYPTIGGIGVENAQPFFFDMPYGITMSQNGNCFNFYELKEEIEQEDLCQINSECDVEAFLHIFRSSLIKQIHRNNGKFQVDQVWKAMKRVFQKTKGGSSIVGYLGKKGIFGFRDPHGIRPLMLGKRSIPEQPDEYCFTSESIVLDILGFEIVGDLEPGEVVFIDDDAKRTVHRKVVLQKAFRPCIFEHVYLARPDSVIDNISVHKARMRMGEYLGKKIKKSKIPIDVVMPVPDSAREAALGAATVLKRPYREGLIKNRYIGRTFIMPGQEMRQKSIRYKLNPIVLEVKNKNVLLVDDSIVRGNTSAAIIQMVRQAGAKKVYFASAAPPLRFPCYYGIDLPTREEFIANKLSEEEICKALGADALFYQDIEDLKKSVKAGNPKIKSHCMACMDGNYPTGDITESTIEEWEEQRRISHEKLEKIKQGLPIING